MTKKVTDNRNRVEGGVKAFLPPSSKKVVKRYKLTVIRQISTGDVMYNTMTIVNTAVWYA